MLSNMLSQLAGVEVDDLPLLLRFLLTSASKANISLVRCQDSALRAPACWPASQHPSALRWPIQPT
jgi:hypothetical protein